MGQRLHGHFDRRLISCVGPGPPTGPELTAFKEQLARLAAATIQLAVDYDENHTAQVDTKIVGGVDFWFEKNERQRVLCFSAEVGFFRTFGAGGVTRLGCMRIWTGEIVSPW